MFASIRPLIAGADVALCHEEVPFAAPGAPLQSYPVFAAPPEAAAWIGSMGFDASRSDDVDLVLGDHSHVVQPIIRVHGTWVVYGMGNLVAQQEVTRPSTYEGILARFRFTERPAGGFEVTPASYVPVGRRPWHPGVPIRVVRLDRRGADQDARAAVAEAVDGLGHAPGLREG